MAQSLKNYQQNLNESQVKLQEIGQRVKPYQNNFVFQDDGFKVLTTFKDEKGNQVDVFFHKNDVKTKSYEVEFTVNKFSKKGADVDNKLFFKIISTVVEVIEKFIENYNPYQLSFEPDEKLGKIDQKYKIWFEYLKINLQNDDYILGKSPNGFSLQINKNK